MEAFDAGKVWWHINLRRNECWQFKSGDAKRAVSSTSPWVLDRLRLSKRACCKHSAARTCVRSPQALQQPRRWCSTHARRLCINKLNSQTVWLWRKFDFVWPNMVIFTPLNWLVADRETKRLKKTTQKYMFRLILNDQITNWVKKWGINTLLGVYL